MEKRTFVDQMGRSVEISFPPQRIVSLVPSQTELLHNFGLENEVVGITKFCIHPDVWFRNKKRIGGTKQLKIDEILALKPYLVIGNKEENTREDIDYLAKHVPVWMSDINSFDESIEMIKDIGELTGKHKIAGELVNSVSYKFDQLGNIGKGRSVLYFIWDEPSFVVGKSTFIDSMLTKIGFLNACKKERYPNLANLEKLKPDFVFLSSEPFPFKEEHISKYKEMFSTSIIKIVDGEFFSWYGSRMEGAPTYFANFV
jgi:ABC-type Fe3+-hydroxamate transport system substrate-binding protein